MSTQNSIEQKVQTGLFCIGCGAKLQYRNENFPGFASLASIQKGIDRNELLCQRCFRLRNYNEIQSVEMQNSDFQAILADIGKSEALVVFVIDVFNIEGSLINGLRRFIGNNKVILLINKMDLLPKEISSKKITQKIEKILFEQGLNISDSISLSALKSPLTKLINLLEQYKNKQDIYFIGTTNVGKSTIVNRVVKYFQSNAFPITTSRFPGTTLDRIEIQFDENKVVDTPGILLEGQMTGEISFNELKYLLPEKTLKPKTFQLDYEQTLFFGGLGRLDVISKKSDSRIGITVYMNNILPIHRTKTSNADFFWEKHLGKELIPISKDSTFTQKTFHVRKKSDIIFSGLGWVAVPRGITITAYVPQNVKLLIREALI